MLVERMGYWSGSESLAEMHVYEALGNLARMGLDVVMEFNNFVENLDIDIRTIGSLYQKLYGQKQRIEETKMLVMEYLVRLGSALNNKDIYVNLALSLDRTVQLIDGAAYRLYMYVANGFKLDEELYSGVKDFIKRLIEEYRILYEGLSKLRFDPKKTLQSMEQVVKIESDLDMKYREIELDLFKKLSSNIPALMLLKEAIDFIEDVADVIKESAEGVRYLALHRVTTLA